MNVVIPLTRPHALPRQQYDEAAVAAGDRRGTVPERELAGTLLRSRRRADEAHAMATERNTSRATQTWAMAGWCCMRRSGCVHRGSLMIETRAWQPRAAVVNRSTTGSEVGAARWWTEASMHRAGRRGFRRGPVTADLERGVWTLAADGPTFGARPARPVGRPAAASASARANAAAAAGASTADATRAERGHDVHKGSGSVPGWRRSAGTTT